VKTVFFDIDTQFDFILPAGALYAPGAEKILPLVAGLNQYAASAGIPVISTTDAHTEDDPEFRDWHPHCVAGALSQQKPASTLLPKRVVVSCRKAEVDIDGAQQIILEKRHVDAFRNENLPGILDRLGAERCIVYGLVTDVCVKFAAIGLLKLATRVEVVEDAVRAIDESVARKFLEAFQIDGGVLTTAHAVMA